MLGISAAFIGFIIMMVGFNTPNWMFLSLPFLQALLHIGYGGGITLVAMPILFVVSFKTISMHQAWTRWRVIYTTVLAVSILIYLISWQHPWWVAQYRMILPGA